MGRRVYATVAAKLGSGSLGVRLGVVVSHLAAMPRGVFGTPNPSASALSGAMLGAAVGAASAGSVALRSASRTPLR